MDENLRAFYDFNSMHMEPWDGPAGIVMSDGRYAACGLDRNGLRPARYVITKDEWITLASEVGIWDYQPDEVVGKGRLSPGELLVIDTEAGEKWVSWEIDRMLKSRHPYKEWMNTCCRFLPEPCLQDHPDLLLRQMDDDVLIRYQKIFGVSSEEIRTVVRSMGNLGKEPVSSMGDDTPMAVLSQRPRSLFDYFRQMFAQVTNPPIDSLRERHVMSLATIIGRERNVFNETLGHAWRVMFQSPVLLHHDFNYLKHLDPEYYRHCFIDLNFSPASGLEHAIREIRRKAVEAAQGPDRAPDPVRPENITGNHSGSGSHGRGGGAAGPGGKQFAVRCQYHHRNRRCPRSAPVCRAVRTGCNRSLPLSCI